MTPMPKRSPIASIPEMADDAVGRRVQAVRLALGMSGHSFASLIGADPPTLSKIEQGKRALSRDMAARIELTTDCPMGYLFLGNLRGVPLDPSSKLFRLRMPE